DDRTRPADRVEADRRGAQVDRAAAWREGWTQMISDRESDPTFEGFAEESAAAERFRVLLRASPVLPLSERIAGQAKGVAARLAAAAGDAPPLQMGEAVGEYEVVRELGRGGQGIVYLGRHR